MPPEPRLALEVLLLRVIHLEPVLPLAEWLARLDTLEKRLEAALGVASGAGEAGARRACPGGQAAGKTAVAPPGPSPDAGPDDRWQAFLTYVHETEGGPLYGKLAQCRLVEIKDNCLTIALGCPWNANGARHEARLQELARNFFGPDTILAFEVDGPKTSKQSPVPASKPLDMQKLQQQALEIFGGEWLGATPGKEEPE